ncbi:MAG TPA: response regulator [Thermoanaerobaculia bacterium]|nr:response regulator [Thermoanaerobaculia bacterium]
MAKVLGTLRLPCDVEDADQAHALAAATPTIGLLAREDEIDFKEWFLLLDSLGCWSVIVLAESNHFGRRRQGYPPEVRQETEKRCAVSRDFITEICRHLIELRTLPKEDHTRETTATRFFRAEKLFELTRYFLHAANLDITNLVLGPARMLLTEPSSTLARLPQLKQSQRIALQLFQKKVIQNIANQPHLYGELGRTLLESFGDVHSSLESRAPYDRPALLSSFDTVLNCLTKSREDSRQSIMTGSRGKENLWIEPVRPRGKGETDDCFRILVVDDFAFTWRPVLENACEMLEMMQLPTIFEISSDGMHVSRDQRTSASIDQALPSYDLILLDIFLGEKNGIKILGQIRERFLWLPVILWTTSVASELPAQAQLANGFIFKKTDTFGKIINLLARWLPEGRARRDAGLSSRLFDTMLRSLPYRRSAIAFEKICLKILDSFHALDNSFFRFYTDHGGRHTQRLLHIVEQLVSPLLSLPADGEDGVFSAEAAVRERELFQLYLAVLCHEMGMFPLRPEKQPPTQEGNLQAIRITHPVRGMLALMDEAYRPRELDEAVRTLGLLGEDGLRILRAVAVLTGYHSRLLEISQEGFLHRVGTEGEKKLGVAQKIRNDPQTVVPDSTQTTTRLEELARLLFGTEGIKSPSGERLRKHCALLRFADALDVDRTRTPAEFLLFDSQRDHLNLREHVKREILDDVEMTPDGILLHFNASRPDTEYLRQFITDAVGLRELCGAAIKPWHHQNRNVLLACQPRLDKWLAYYWFEVLRRRPLLPQPSTRNQEAKERQAQDFAEDFPALDDQTLFSEFGRTLIASITALSVSGEILDEYTAITECGLEGRITLAGVTWRDYPDWPRLPLLSFISPPDHGFPP